MTAKKTDETDQETHVLSGVSSSQVVGGALAAMTAAVAGSWLGVAGTLIGAAVGSVVATIAGTIYTNSLRKSRRLAEAARLTTRAALANRVTAPGRPTVVMPTAPDAAEALAEAEGADADAADDGTPADKPKRLIPWRAAAVAAVVSLVLALGGIWAYEKVAGHPIGSSDKPGTTFSNVRSGDSDGSGGAGDSDGSDDRDREDAPDQQQSPSQTPTPTTPSRDSEPTPAPDGSTAPTPTPSSSPSTTPEPADPTPPPIREDAEGLAPEQPAPQAETTSPAAEG